jgi:type II secretory pathway predicted ATPase ExeA
MVKHINDEGKYHCVYVNVESAQTARNNVMEGMTSILTELDGALAEFLDAPFSIDSVETIKTTGAHSALSATLQHLCQSLDKPLVLFIDEIDALIGDTLVSILRQLRSSYAKRPSLAPISVILCGVRDIRDYRIHTSDGEIITGGSCFNVKAESLRLGDFSQDEIQELYKQHTTATGQVFEEALYPKVWDLTHGQPWLVNALAHQAT